MEETTDRSTAPLETPIEPLRWIGAYKLLKAALSLVGALMILRLMHRNLPEVAERWMGRLHIEPHSTLGKVILHRILMIKKGSMGLAAGLLFAYIPVAVAEGIGLILRKIWAEWLALITTGAMIPLEIYEIHLRMTWLRVVILIANIAVLIYLIIRLRRDRPGHAVPSGVLVTSEAAGLSQNTSPPPRAPQSDVPG